MKFLGVAGVSAAVLTAGIAYAAFEADSLKPKEIIAITRSNPFLLIVDLVAFIIVMSYILDNLVADPQQQSTARTQGSVQKPSQGSKQMKKEVDSHHFDLLQKRKAELLDYCRKKYLEKYGG